MLTLLPVIAQLLPLVTKVAPWISSTLNGAGDQSVGAIIDAATKVFGTIDKAEIERQIAEDNNKLQKFKAELDAHRAELEAVLKDVQSARGMTVSLVKAGSIIGYGSVVISIIVVLGFFGITAFFFWGNPNPEHAQTLNLLVGAFIAAFSAVVSFWIGSSTGSKQKDFALANSMPASVAERPAADAAKTRKRPTLE